MTVISRILGKTMARELSKSELQVPAGGGPGGGSDCPFTNCTGTTYTSSNDVTGATDNSTDWDAVI